MLNLVKQILEQLKRFLLVFLLGVLLGIATQMNALTQVIHAGQMLFPVSVENLQHEMLLNTAHVFHTDLCFLAQVIGFHVLDQLFHDAINVQLVIFIEPLAHRRVALEFGFQGFFQTGDIPLVFH